MWYSNHKSVSVATNNATCSCIPLYRTCLAVTQSEKAKSGVEGTVGRESGSNYTRERRPDSTKSGAGGSPILHGSIRYHQTSHTLTETHLSALGLPTSTTSPTQPHNLWRYGLGSEEGGG
jgi:hypothetical protein